MQRRVDLLLRALVAVVFMALATAGAYAGTCTATGLPSGVTVGTVKTSAGPPITGGLNNLSVPAGLECEPASTWLIPFSVAAAEDVLLSISEVSSAVKGTYFDVLVGDSTGSNTTAYNQAAIPATSTGGVNEIIAVSAGVGTLSITEFTSAASFGTNGTNDSLSLSMAFQNFIPEPATMSLLGFGAICLAALRRRRQHQA